jgi:FixJ family two-component response regulator
MMNRINVIDPDVRRRANVARQLMARGHHAEIFEDVGDFAKSGALTGMVFMSDDSVEPVAEAISRLGEATNKALPIVLYAEDPNPELVVDAIRAGALDYLQWPFTGRLLDKVFKRLASEGRKLERQSLRNEARAKVGELSGRETDVLALLVQGMPNKEMARTLGISHRTVEIHRANMMSKLGAQSTPDAVRLGIYAGLDEIIERETLVLVGRRPAWHR